jgi:hypothetical protein
MLRATDFSPILWSIVEQAGGSEEKLTQLLMSAEKDTIALVHREFLRALFSLRKAADDSDALSSESDDTIEDILAYAISMGRSYYDRVLEHPDELLRDVDPGDVPINWVPGQVFWKRFGEEIMESKR